MISKSPIGVVNENGAYTVSSLLNVVAQLYVKIRIQEIQRWKNGLINRLTDARRTWPAASTFR